MELAQTNFIKSEVGLIPDDWQVSELADIVDFLDGQRKPIKDTDRIQIQGQYPYYGASGIIDYVNDFIFDEELILLGEDGENILSRNVRLAFKVHGKIWVNNHAHVLKPKKHVDIGFLTEKLESINYEKYNSGTAQPKLNQKACSKILLALPVSKSEQTAIATALSDSDTLIENLEKLIAKKRDIKQGVMQELLSGKKRLNGYNEKWEEKKLGKLVKFQVGFPFSANYFNQKEEGIRLVKNRDLKSDDQVFYFNAEYPKEYLVHNGDILVGMDGDFLLCNWSKGEALLNQRVGRIVKLKDINLTFLYSYLQKYLTEIQEKTSSTTVKHLSHSIIENIVLPLPCFEEQKDISDILSNMTIEIGIINQQLQKYKMIKQGMMQVLLTGKIRLI